jgi:uncharacterized protein (DUF2267 family)
MDPPSEPGSGRSSPRRSPTANLRFRRAEEHARIWLRDYGDALGQTNERLCFRGLGAFLHCLRDHLPVSEAVGLGAQLPMIVRGLYYDGWRPARTPLDERSAEAVRAQVADELEHGLGANPDEILRAGAIVLSRHVDRRELAHLQAVLPRPLRELWPESAGSRTP